MIDKLVSEVSRKYSSLNVSDSLLTPMQLTQFNKGEISTLGTVNLCCPF